MLTCAHNLTDKFNILDEKLSLAVHIFVILGKYQNPGHIEVLNDSSTLKLILDPKDILIPSKYKYNSPEGGYDIALIGLSK